jgi:tetratricopeptide (TPR) repeat protein
MENKDQPPSQKEANKGIDPGAAKLDLESPLKSGIEIKEAQQQLGLTKADDIKPERKKLLETKAIGGGQKQKNVLDKNNIEKLKTSKKSPFGESAVQNHGFIVAIVLIMCLSIAAMSPAIIGMRLSALYGVSNALPAAQSIQIILAYADNLASTKHYDQAISIYKIATKKIKQLNLDKQLLGLADFKLAQVLLESTPEKSKEIDEVINEGLTSLGNPQESTPTNLVETIRRLGVYYTDKGDPYRAYPLVEAASRFWRTGITRNSEGNTYADLGEKFKDKQAWALAYICYEHAFSQTKSWGDADYNAYRLSQMGLAKAHLNKTEEAVALLSQAMEMDKRVHRGGLSYSAPQLPVYVDSLIKLNEIFQAKKVLKDYYSYFDTKDYYDCQKKIALSYQKNKNSDEAIDILKGMLKDDIAGRDVPDVPTIKKTLSQLEATKFNRAKQR